MFLKIVAVFIAIFLSYMAMKAVYSTITYWRLKTRAEYWESIAREKGRKLRRMRREMSMMTLELLKHRRLKSRFQALIKEKTASRA